MICFFVTNIRTYRPCVCVFESDARDFTRSERETETKGESMDGKVCVCVFFWENCERGENNATVQEKIPRNTHNIHTQTVCVKTKKKRKNQKARERAREKKQKPMIVVFWPWALRENYYDST